MVEAIMTHSLVMHEAKTGMVLMGTFQRADDCMNFRVPFDWHEVEDDEEEFFNALRESIAENYDIHVKFVDIQRDKLMKRMAYYSKQAQIQGFID
jgi:hypothetical protein